MLKVASKYNSIKHMIYSDGRLLDRKLFQYFFEGGTKEACVRALEAYQNEDGGFGNGLEPDLLTPSSSAIAAETALYVMDLVDYSQGESLSKLTNWLNNHTNNQGYIHHPPVDLKEYPHQPWWENPDNDRVFSIAGMLRKFGIDCGIAEKRIACFAEQIQMPPKIEFYSYPLLIYAIYNMDFPDRYRIIEYYVENFSGFLNENERHYPLFSRYWYHAIPFLSYEVVNCCAKQFIDGIQENGSIINPYPQLPKWNSIFTLDGLMILKKFDMII